MRGQVPAGWDLGTGEHLPPARSQTVPSPPGPAMPTVLHTSDWHLGARLADQSRLPEQRLFLDWLLHHLQEGGYDTLVVAGDIFDQSNPPVEARALYYRFLARLHQVPGITAILVAGNHDSAPVIDAPAEILRVLRVRVVGEPTDVAISLPGLQVLAMPFLRAADLPLAPAGEAEADRLERVATGVRARYAAAREKLGDGPLLCTGHFFLHGSRRSDTERTFLVGQQLGLPVDVLPVDTGYAALGHLHRPQEVRAPFPAVYSGAPVPMGFSEADCESRVVRVEVGDTIRHMPVPVPRFRALKGLTGTLGEVMAQVLALPPVGDLDGWLSAEITLEGDPRTVQQELEAALHPKGWRLIQLIRRRPGGAAFEAPESDLTLDRLDPVEVFRTRYRQERGGDVPDTLMADFRALLAAVEEEGP